MCYLAVRLRIVTESDALLIGKTGEAVAYARVNTCGQTLDAQLEQLREAGCARIFHEKVTCARADRKELLKALKHLRYGHERGCEHLVLSQ